MAKIPHNLSADHLAKLMTEVSSDLLKTEKSNVTSRWFRAGEDLELFAWLDQKHKLIRLQVVIFDQVLEWDLISGLRTGFVEETPVHLKLQKPSSLIVYDKRINQPTVELVKEIIAASHHMHSDLKKCILDTVIEPKTIQDISFFEMLKNLFR